ncbi:MAG TPA: hypothetical protein VFK38_06300 [Candidatus Limnocylindrales bacterium]|nr:hypothetical protein [Candidatus Limnocylindrales bacterium]
MTTQTSRHQPSPICGPRGRPLLVPIVLGLVVLACSAGVQAGRPDGWRAGQPDRQRLPVASDDAGGRALQVGRLVLQLELTGKPGPVERYFEAVEQRVFDNLDLLGPDDEPVGSFRFDAATGRLAGYVRTEWRADFALPRVDEQGAVPAAQRFALRSGVALPAVEPTVAWDGGWQAWEVRWPRLADGIAVVGDGVTVAVLRGGQLKAISIRERPLRPAPLRPIGPAEARVIAERFATGSIHAPDLRIEAVRQAWLAGNDFAAPDGPDVESAELRLAYVVRFSHSVAGWTERQVLELYVDAGDGRIIGGAETS